MHLNAQCIMNEVCAYTYMSNGRCTKQVSYIYKPDFVGLLYISGEYLCSEKQECIAHEQQIMWAPVMSVGAWKLLTAVLAAVGTVSVEQAALWCRSIMHRFSIKQRFSIMHRFNIMHRFGIY